MSYNVGQDVKFDKSDSYGTINKWKVTFVFETVLGRRYTLENTVSGMVISGVAERSIAEC